jgi:hypothetical protein
MDVDFDASTPGEEGVIVALHGRGTNELVTDKISVVRRRSEGGRD